MTEIKFSYRERAENTWIAKAEVPDEIIKQGKLAVNRWLHLNREAWECVCMDATDEKGVIMPSIQADQPLPVVP